MQWRLENEEQIGVPIQNHQYVGDCAACDTLQIIHLFPMWVDGGGDGGGDGENIITATALRMRCSVALNMADMEQYFCFVTLLCAK